MAPRGWWQIGISAILGICVVLAIHGSQSCAEEAARADEADKLVDKSNGNIESEIEKFDLRSNPDVGSVWKVTSRFEVGGHLTVARHGGFATGEKKVNKLPMSVVAQLDYEERILENTPTLRSVRHYDKAEATIKVGRGGIHSKLDPKRQRILVRVTSKPTAVDSRISMSSPGSELSRDELDLIDVVGNSLILADLLPSRPVAIGEYWNHDSDTIAALVGLEAVATCEVRSVIGSVDGDRVTLSLAGLIQGASEGAASEIELKANYQFDLKERKITQFNLAIQEKRPMGHVSPGVDVTAKLSMRIEPLAEANHLTSEAIALLPTKQKQDSTHLVYESSNGSYRLRYDGKWFVTNESPKQLVLRRVDRGDLIAQCNLTQLTKTKSSRHMTLKKFQQDVQFTLGDRFDQFIAAGQRENKSGYREFRVVVRGRVEDLPIQWRYYLLADRHGNRLSVLFTVDESLVQQLGDADRALVAGVTLIDKPPQGKTAQNDLPPAPEPSTQPTAGRPSRRSSVLQ